jgi:DNA-binding NtrC family response regulator
MADAGTLYLDEIGELDSRMQVRLLRVLDGAAFYRVGGLRKVQVDVRLVAATNRDLEEAVRDRTFRSDVFHRICQVRIDVPPLRQRRDDILPLARFFLAQHKPDAVLSPAAAEILEARDWPGNVRELRNCIIQAALLHDGGVITPAHLAPSEEPVDAGPTAEMLAFPGQLGDLERNAIRQTLRHTEGNQTQAAELLGISRRTLLRRLKDYELEEQASLAAH